MTSGGAARDEMGETSTPVPILRASSPATVRNRVTSLRDSGGAAAHVDARDTVDPAAGEHQVALPRGHHVTHDAASGGNDPGLELLGGRIEADERVGPHPRLAVPDDVPGRSDPVGPRLGAAG